MPKISIISGLWKKNEKYFCEVDRTYAQIETWKSSLAFYRVRPTSIFFYNTLIQETKTAIPTSVQSFKKEQIEWK